MNHSILNCLNPQIPFFERTLNSINLFHYQSDFSSYKNRIDCFFYLETNQDMHIHICIS